ncbi:hypothetical protein GCM10011335_46020 [Aureimonas glaciei]|uniref:Fosmidomycin resistance protein n=1 Tax=Aureimonas glaciei TaxID=1776957 RepID=A0A916YB61_9HYPH|nr:hypothetical protein GCM10011335_46020 [Aureimonas glaciei]
MTLVAPAAPRFERVTLSVLVAVSVCHMLNDIMQSLLASLYPLLKQNYDLDFVQIGLLTMTFQVTASLLQPAVGIVTDRWPLPYSLPVGMLSTMCGLLLYFPGPTVLRCFSLRRASLASARQSFIRNPRASHGSPPAVATASPSRYSSSAEMREPRSAPSLPLSSFYPSVSAALRGSP